MNWASMPYMRIAFVFILGIWSFYYFSLPSLVFLYGFIASIILYFSIEWGIKNLDILPKSALTGGLLLLVFYFLGGWLFNQKHEKVNYLVQLKLEDLPYEFIGTIEEPMKSNFGPKYVIKLNQLRRDEKILDQHQGNLIIVHFHQVDSSAYHYKEGDKILVRGNLKKIPSNTNPEAFDYSRYLYFKDILYSIKVPTSHHRLVAVRSVSRWSNIVYAVRDYGQKTLDKYMSSSLEKGVVEALILGKRINLDQNIYKNYSNTGAVHVLAVSGLHVGIFISVFMALFNRVRYEDLLWKIAKVLILVTLIFLYVMVTGASPSVIRAGVMISFYIVGKTFFDRVNAYNILSVAALLMLMWNPFMLFQASFQFSFLALLSILYFHPKIVDWITPTSMIVRFLWTIVSVSIAAQILIFPFSVYYFHQFPVYFAFSSLLAIPLVTVIIYMGMLILIFESFYSAINPFLVRILEFIISFLNENIQAISQWPYGLVENIWLSDWGLILCVVAILLGIFWWEYRKIAALYLSLSCLILIIIDDSYRLVSQLNSYQLVIYDTYGSPVMDVKSQKKHYTLRMEDADGDKEDFVAKNYRIKNKFKTPIESNSNLIQIDNKYCYWYVDDIDFRSLRRDIPIETLVITNNSKLSPLNIVDKFQPKYIVLVKNLKPWIREKWLNLPLDTGIEIHDIREKGAFFHQY